MGSRQRRNDRFTVPADTTAFLRSFRALTPRECASIAAALDAQPGLEPEDDYLLVFRLGDAYVFPTRGQYGAIANRAGKIVAMLVIPD